MLRTLRIVARDPDLVPRGFLPYQRATLNLSWLHPSTWEVVLPDTAATQAATQPGWGIIAYLDDTQVLSGSLEDPEGEKTAALDVVTLAGADDLAVVAGELAYPDPARAATAQTTATHDARTGPMETVVKGYVAANVGTGRHANRRDPAAPSVRELVVAPDLGRGGAVSYQARFDPLMDIVRGLAPTGGLGVTCYQDGSQLVFDVVEPQDLTATATFSFQARNLARCRWSTGLPEATHVVAAGGDEGTARVFRERKDSAAAEAWRMISRRFVDQRHTTDTAELDQAADEELADATRTGVIEADLVDTARLAYGRDYQLGDRVTISPRPGVEFSDVITGVRIVADAGQGTVTITPSVGWPAGPFATRQDKTIWQLARALSALERSR